jgi:hypothetical protein
MQRGLGMKYQLFAALGALFIAGCSTTAIQVKEATQAPETQVRFHNNLPAQGNARAVFVRDTGLFGAGVFQHLFIDGEEAAVLNPGEKVELILPPGEHIFGVQPTDPFGFATMNSIDQDLKADRSYFYRIMMQGEDGMSTVQRFIPPAK